MYSLYNLNYVVIDDKLVLHFFHNSLLGTCFWLSYIVRSHQTSYCLPPPQNLLAHPFIMVMN